MTETRPVVEAHDSDMMQSQAEARALGEGEGPSGHEPIGIGRLVALIGGPVLALVILLLPPPEGMPPAAWQMVSLTAWMVVWWLGEAVPIPATALLPIPLMPLFGIGAMGPVAANYADNLIFLFLGGFLLAAAMQRWGLHRRIALKIVAAVGTSPGSIIGGFMIATAFLSMWISNTATTVMMFAVAISVVDFIGRSVKDERMLHNFGVALMLGVAYSASIGGVGTLIGTPPNALLASFLSSTYEIKIDFFTWMLFGVPIVLVMLPLAWLLLTKVIFPARNLRIGDAGSVIKHELGSLGAMSYAEKVVGVVFLGAAISWIFRKPFTDATGLPINDTSIAMLAALILFAWPVSRARGTFVLDWEVARNVPWGVLLLFGGGLALAGGFKDTGLAEWIGQSVTGFDVSTLVLVFIVTAAIIYLTEITSNTASTATFLPILGAVAIGLDLDPRTLVIPVAVGASMAFMMPVATPPNAIVFSYEKMKLRDMVVAGFWLNILAVIVTFGAMYYLAGAVFGI